MDIGRSPLRFLLFSCLDLVIYRTRSALARTNGGRRHQLGLHGDARSSCSRFRALWHSDAPTPQKTTTNNTIHKVLLASAQMFTAPPPQGAVEVRLDAIPLVAPPRLAKPAWSL